MRVAIVDDQRIEVEKLRKCILSFCKENDILVDIATFSDGEGLLWDYKADYDIVFLDIEMKRMDGLTTARKLRKVDTNTILIFVTQMKQYALEGYGVEALDYIVKPVEYYSFALVLRKALRHVGNKNEQGIILNLIGSKKMLYYSEIYYVEVLDHYLTYHTTQGDIRVKGSLNEVQRQLPETVFFKCNRYCLINVRYVSEVRITDLILHGETIEMKRNVRHDLLRAIAQYRGGIV